VALRRQRSADRVLQAFGGGRGACGGGADARMVACVSMCVGGGGHQWLGCGCHARCRGKATHACAHRRAVPRVLVGCALRTRTVHQRHTTRM
jgi:hypothetical protein